LIDRAELELEREVQRVDNFLVAFHGRPLCLNGMLGY
jgi:hypothetical protein